MAIMKIENGEFSLFPTAAPVPMRSQWEEITYYSTIIVDRKAKRGYLLGQSRNFRDEPTKPHRQYVLAIDYAHATEGKGAPLTLFYTDSLSIYPDYTPVLTDDGNLVMAGGLQFSNLNANYAPSAEVYLLHVGTPVVAKSERASLWWLVLTVVVLIVLFAYLLYMRKHRHPQVSSVATLPEEGTNEKSEELLQRIRSLIESQKLYTNSELKVSDVAALLKTNSRYVSDCVNSLEGCTFIQFVNRYRVEHAKQMMRDNPDVKNYAICSESGFANQQSFIRIFKQMTGQTPSEWKSNV